MSRRNAREIVYKLTFEYLFYEVENTTTEELLLLDASLTDDDKDYIDRVYRGVIRNAEQIRAMVDKYSTGFAVDRIYKPDLAALMVAVYELRFETEIPAAVIINSAVEIVKRYSSEKSNSFVNGILASVNKEVRGDN